ncbi:MAG: DUF6488 family protein [Candidatus Thiodiazotropha endolucinida]
MRIKSLFLCLVLTFLPIAVFAGEGHDHGHGHSHGPATEDRAIKIATNVVSNIANKGIIEESWKSVRATKAEQKEFSGKKEWVVIFKNDKVTDAAKQKLYIFLSLEGKYLAANYTGK